MLALECLNNQNQLIMTKITSATIIRSRSKLRLLVDGTVIGVGTPKEETCGAAKPTDVVEI